MEVTGLSAYLFTQGVLGAAVVWLLYDRQQITKRFDALQAAYLATLDKTVADVTKALTSSTDAMRANTSVQERGVDSGRAIAEAIKLMQVQLGSLEKDVERLDREPSS